MMTFKIIVWENWWWLMSMTVGWHIKLLLHTQFFSKITHQKRFFSQNFEVSLGGIYSWSEIHVLYTLRYIFIWIALSLELWWQWQYDKLGVHPSHCFQRWISLSLFCSFHMQFKNISVWNIHRDRINTFWWWIKI